MKIKCLIATYTLLIMFVACKKNNTDILPAPATNPKVKSLTISNGATTVNSVQLIYDNQGRRTKQTYLNGSNFTYSYGSTAMILQFYNTGGILTNTYTYNLGASGLIDNVFDNATPTSIHYYLYNAQKNIIKETVKNNGTTTSENFYTWNSAGNKIKDSTPAPGGTATVRIYDYYTDKISTIENVNFGAEISGASNKNSLKSVVTQNPNGTTSTASYTNPEVDEQGRTIKQSYTLGANTYDQLYTYY